MRVIQLGPFPPPHGGVQTNLVAIRDHLRARGHRAGVVHLTRHRRANADEVFYPESAVATARLLLSEPADILHIHIGGQLNTRLLALCLYCTLLRRKSVLTFHSGGFCSSPEGQKITPSSFAARVLRRLDAIIGVNAQIVDFFVQRCGVARERVHLISPHASVLGALEKESALPAPLQQFFDTHDPALLSVGLLEPEYDLPLQIETLSHVRRTHPQAGLLMIGSGSLESELRQRIAAQPDSAHMLLAGDVSHASTLRAIRDCRILLRTTHYDGDALSVREALEIGTPVIATDNKMRPPGCHLIPAPPQQQPLLDQIEQVLAAPALRSGIAGRPSDTANVDAVLSLYESLRS
ncbi:MAG: glycosyltransferase family 4 protein [Bryobacteraceae bacterium]